MKIIQVGIGGMGNAWLNAVLSSSEVEYAGFVEINAEIARTQVERYGLDDKLIFPSLKDALAAVKPDGILDITPPQFHKEISLAALAAGIPVLSEKPLADTLESAREIVNKADESGVLHMVAQNRRYSVPAQTLKQVITSGEIGTIASVSVEFFRGPHFGGFREQMPYPLIIDMAIHHFDMMRFFLDSDPVSVFGRSWNPSWSWFKGDASASLILEFADNVTVSYDGSWCSLGTETSWNAHWRFECEKGAILMRDDQVFTQTNEGSLKAIRPLEPEFTDQSYLLHEFYEAVTKGKAPATTCQDNIKSLGIVFDCIKSFESGAVVRSEVQN